MFPNDIYGRCSNSTDTRLPNIPRCLLFPAKFALLERDSASLKVPHALFYLLDGFSVLSRCGSTFLTIFHTMKHILDLEFSSD
jgi:hypothetical protein